MRTFFSTAIPATWHVIATTTGNTTNRDNANGNNTCYNFDNSLPAIASQLLMSSVIIILNSMVVAVIYKGPKKTHARPAFIFITGLATTDMLLALSLLSFSVVSIGKYQLTASTWVLLTASTSVCFNASVNFLLVIAVDRLCFIGYNRRYQNWMTRCNISILIALCWVIGIIPVLPLFLGNIGSCAALCQCYKDERLVCPDPICSTVIVGFTKRFLFGLFFYFLIMFISISTIYVILFWKVRHHSLRVRNQFGEGSARSRSSRMSREFKLARTLGIVVISFFVCWSPLMLLYVIDFATKDDFQIDTIVAQAIMSPAVLNSMLNPIIYAARIPLMRKYFCPCFCRTDDVSTDGTASTRTNRSGKSAKLKTQKKNTSTAYKSNNEQRCSLNKESHNTYSHVTSSAAEPITNKQKNKKQNAAVRVLHVVFGLFQSQSHAAEPLSKASNLARNSNVRREHIRFSALDADVSITPLTAMHGAEKDENVG